MLVWRDFAQSSPDIAATGLRLFNLNEVAFLATVSKSGRPRLHPFVPKIVDNHLLAFIMDSSPKINDLKTRRQYSIHTLPGRDDEEFFVSGEASYCNDYIELRRQAEIAMGFVTGVDEHHVLFEFKVDRALWTSWLDFGTPKHRPNYKRWAYSELT